MIGWFIVVIVSNRLRDCEAGLPVKHFEPWLHDHVVPLSYDIDIILPHKRETMLQYLHAGLGKHQQLIEAHPTLLELITEQFVSHPGSFFIADVETGDMTSPQPHHLQFIGAVSISVEVTSATSDIRIYVGDRINVLVSNTSLVDNPHEVVNAGPDRKLIKFASVIEANSIINISFIYVSHFEYVRNPKEDIPSAWIPQAWRFTKYGKILLSTLNEPDRARQMFPGFDDPKFKSSFHISLTVPSHFMTFSNEAEDSRRLLMNNSDVAGKMVQFKPTQVMSTYLVAIAAGDFVSSRQYLIRNMTWRCVRQNSTTNLPYRLRRFEVECREFIRRAAALYNNARQLLGIDPHMSSKMDLIGIHGYLNGMEHAGIIMFNDLNLMREHIGLLLTRNASWNYQLTRNARRLKKVYTKKLQDTITVQAHEIAHQWFGNLVTMRWWNDLWLNEALSEYVQYELISRLGSPWKKLGSDSLNLLLNREPIYGSSYTRSTIASTRLDYKWDSLIGNMVVYDRGAGMLFMLEDTISKETMYDGLSIYLNRYKYSVATTTDFLSCIQEAVNKSNLDGPGGKQLNVTEFLYNWIYEPDIPYVSIEGSQDGKSITFSQQPLSGKITTVLWSIPITLTFHENNRPHIHKIWLSDQNKTVIMDDLIIDDNYNSSFLTLYSQLYNMYMVKYDFISLDMALEKFPPTCGEKDLQEMLTYFANHPIRKQREIIRIRESCIMAYRDYYRIGYELTSHG